MKFEPKMLNFDQWLKKFYSDTERETDPRVECICCECSDEHMKKCKECGGEGVIDPKMAELKTEYQTYVRKLKNDLEHYNKSRSQS